MPGQGEQKGKEKKAQTSRNEVTFSIATYKFHSLGDYAAHIKMYGTCDSYSTESVSLWPLLLMVNSHVCSSKGELEHRTAKSRYRRTDRKSFLKQMTEIERRQARIRKIRAKNTISPGQAVKDDITLSPEVRYNIGKTENFPEDVGHFVHQHEGDPAHKV